MTKFLARCAIALLTIGVAACSTPPAADDGSIPGYTRALRRAARRTARALLDTPFTGDLDKMVKRRMIRAASPSTAPTTSSTTDSSAASTYESLTTLRERSQRRSEDRQAQGERRDRAVVPRSALPGAARRQGGHGRREVTVTPEREKMVAFSLPTRRDVERGRRHRPGGAADRDARRSRGPGSRSSARAASTKKPGQPQPQLAARGKAPVVIVPRAGSARRR